MKKNLSIALLSLLSLGSLWGQNQAVEDLLSEYRQAEKVICFTLNQQMLDAVDLDFDWKEQLRHLEGDIYQVEMMAMTEGSHAAGKLSRLREALIGAGLRQVELPDDPDHRKLDGEVRMYASKKGKYYDRIYLLILSDREGQGAVIAVNGKLTLSKV